MATNGVTSVTGVQHVSYTWHGPNPTQYDDTNSLFSRACWKELELAVGENHAEWRRRQSQLEQVMFDDVRARLNDDWTRMKQVQQEWSTSWTPQPHDLCYVFDASATAEVWWAYAETQAHPFKSRKLATNWHGPYLVDSMVNPSTVLVIVPYKRGHGKENEISWKERFPLRHVQQHGQESFVNRSTPGEVCGIRSAGCE